MFDEDENGKLTTCQYDDRCDPDVAGEKNARALTESSHDSQTSLAERQEKCRNDVWGCILNHLLLSEGALSKKDGASLKHQRDSLKHDFSQSDVRFSP